MVVQPQICTSVLSEMSDWHNQVHNHILDHIQLRHLLLQLAWKVQNKQDIFQAKERYTKEVISKESSTSEPWNVNEQKH